MPTNIKPKRGVGSVITRQRKKIQDQIERSREERLRSEREYAERAVRRNVVNQLDEAAIQHQLRVKHAVNVLTSNHAAFHSALGVEATIDFRVIDGGHRGVTAWTNFDVVHVMTPCPPANKSLREFIVEMRGVLHHETGHVRFTKPLPKLIEDAVDDGFIIDEQYGSPEALARRIARTWNTLEDQRMEAAVVRHTPRIASYFIPMVLNIVMANENDSHRLVGIENYLLVGGRRYLPAGVREVARQSFVQVTDEDTLRAWDAIIKRYMSATNDIDMLNAILDAYEVIKEVGRRHSEGDEEMFVQSAFGHAQMDIEEHDRLHDATDPPSAPLNESATDDGDEQKKENAEAGEAGDGESDDDEAGDGESDDEDDDANTGPADGEAGDQTGDDGDGNGDSASDETSDSSANDSPGGGGSSDDESDIKQSIEDYLRNAVRDATALPEVEKMLSEVYERYDKSPLPQSLNAEMEPMADSHVEIARNMSGELRDALTEFLVGNSPLWQHRQEEGYIDALAYRTRDVGQRDYRRHMTNLDNKGVGVHVSFLADVSASMAGNLYDLSATAWAFKTACDALDIPSTVVAWSERRSTTRVWDTEQPDFVTLPLGSGTEPSMAFDDLDNHIVDINLHHLVIVFTDGQWSVVPDVEHLKREGRTIVLIGLRCAQVIEDKRADVTVNISSIDELGTAIRHQVVHFVRANSK